MKTAPLKVLLLGWDAPDAPTAAAVPSTAALLLALAPLTDLTLLLPRLSEPMQLSTLFQTTGLGNLTAEEVALLDSLYETDGLQTRQWPAGLDPATAAGSPAAPYAGRSEHHPAAFATPPAGFEGPAVALEGGSVGVNEAADLSTPDSASPSGPDGYDDAPSNVAELPEPSAASHVEAAPETEFSAPAGELPVRNSILDVALAALQALPTDEASLNFRVIQYARLATRLAASQSFAVIYASDWQSWLAAMEIRQLTGKPLVLHVHSLAQERNTPADRGWVTELERIALRRADLVLAATPALAQRATEAYELDPKRVRCLDQTTPQDPDLLAETILSALREVS